MVSPLAIQHFYTNPDSQVTSCGNVAPLAPCHLRNDFYARGLWPDNTDQVFTPSATNGRAVWVMSLGILTYRLSIKICNTKHAQAIRSLHARALRYHRIVLAKLLSSEHLQRALLISDQLPTAAPKLVKLYVKVLHLLSKRQSWDYIMLLLGVVALLIQLASVIHVLVESFNLVTTRMTFGQIVAVGIWIPVLLEYAYLEFSKFPLLQTKRQYTDSVPRWSRCGCRVSSESSSDSIRKATRRR